jgi:hypothetical protein
MAAATSEADRLQAEMRQVRTELRADVHEVVASAREIADWRQYVRSSPWLALGAAVAVGYFLVPGRTVVVRPSAEDLRALVESQKLVVNVDGQGKPKQTVVASLIGMATGMLVQGGLAVASYQLDQFLKRLNERPASAASSTQPQQPGDYDHV